MQQLIVVVIATDSIKHSKKDGCNVLEPMGIPAVVRNNFIINYTYSVKFEVRLRNCDSLACIVTVTVRCVHLNTNIVIPPELFMSSFLRDDLNSAKFQFVSFYVLYHSFLLCFVSFISFMFCIIHFFYVLYHSFLLCFVSFISFMFCTIHFFYVLYHSFLLCFVSFISSYCRYRDSFLKDIQLSAVPQMTLSH